jgi:anti-sigma regulatory factor (Ser/Thr protein kinase)
MEIVDDGHEFDPTEHPSPDIERRIEDGLDGGLGLELVRRICPAMTSRREDGLNRLALSIDL